MEIIIPGKNPLIIKNLVFDYNGTIATDGKISEITKLKLKKLSTYFSIYVLTADTYGFAKHECEDLPLRIITFPDGIASIKKAEIVQQLGPKETACIGNGFNDCEMCKIAALSVAIINEEGLCTELLKYTDILCFGITNTCDLFLNPKRIIANLRH